MDSHLLFLPFLLPAAFALVVLVLPRGMDRIREWVGLLATATQLGLAIGLFGKDLALVVPWAGFGMDLSLRLGHFGGFALLATAGFALLIAIYSLPFMREHPNARAYWFFLLLTLALTSGAFVADNLVALLFFWEGLLLPLVGMIAIGGAGVVGANGVIDESADHEGNAPRRGVAGGNRAGSPLDNAAWKTAVKALIINGFTDLCLMLGIGLTGYLAGTLEMSQIHISSAGWGGLAFVLLSIGAVSKAGSLPFHTWIPDAAVDAPLPFMAYLPAALEKLLGIYLLARISLDMFALAPKGWASMLLMILGAVTILVAVMMALVQKDYKRLLSYHAISQVGYMILGIGTAVPVGIVGGLFHMINHAMYKCCLFLTAGAVEKQAGTTDLKALGGLGRAMPWTFASFIVAAAAISGVPPFNGFFSKELIYDGALERSWIFYGAAVLGSFLTAASFLKLGHAAYVDTPRDPDRFARVREAPMAMLIPMGVLALGCIVFGVHNALPLHHLIQPILGEVRMEGHDFAGLPHSVGLVMATLVVIGLAIGNHMWGRRSGGSGLHAADHIHNARSLEPIYHRAEARLFDPYEQGMRLVDLGARTAFAIDRGVNWIYDVFSVRLLVGVARDLRGLHNGSLPLYVGSALVGLLVLFALLGISG